MFVLLMVAQIMLLPEECASDTGQGQRFTCAAVKDAQIELSMEEYALGMVQRSSDAAMKDAQIKLR